MNNLKGFFKSIKQKYIIAMKTKIVNEIFKTKQIIINISKFKS